MLPKNDPANEPSPVSPFSPELKAKLDRVEGPCDEFEKLWKAGRRPQLEEFLARQASPDRDLFSGLVELDIDYRRRAGESVSFEQYCERFPAFEAVLAEQDWQGDPALSILGERYELRGEIGKGSFGEVWRAYDTTLQRLVALKCLHDDFSEKAFRILRREARAVAGLDHPSVVKVLDCGRGPKGAVIVFEYVEGISLQDWVVRTAPPRQTAPAAAASTTAGASATATVQASLTAVPPAPASNPAASAKMAPAAPFQGTEGGPALPPALAARLVLQILEGVQHIHDRGVVHRDLKPGNILVTPDGMPKIIDFGLSKHENVLSTLTDDGKLLGTVPYMSPEQCQGKPLGPATDIYAMGVILFELLTGERPFEGGKRDELIQKIVAGPPAKFRPADVPQDLRAICLKAIERNPARRYASAAAMAEHLRRYVDSKPLPFLMRHRELVRSAQGFARIGGIGLAVAASLFAAGVVLFPPKPDPRPMVVVETVPPGAKLSLFPMDRKAGRIFTDRAVRPAGPTPAAFRLEPGDYLIVAALEDGTGRFHEVYRHVPGPDEPAVTGFRHLKWFVEGPGRIRLPTIEIPEASVTADMARVDGTTDGEAGQGFVCGRSGTKAAPRTRVQIPDFLVDSAEVTLAQYQETLRVSPSNEPSLKQQDPGSPVCVSFEEAVARAEDLGKRLLEEAEFEFVATGRGERQFPWEDPADGREVRPYQDRLVLGGKAVSGLCSGHAEWTDMSRLDPREKAGADLILPGSFPFLRPVRGGGKLALEDPTDFSLRDRDPEYRTLVSKFEVRKGLGFRCGRSAAPRLHPEDFVRVVPESPAEERLVQSGNAAP